MVDICFPIGPLCGPALSCFVSSKIGIFTGICEVQDLEFDLNDPFGFAGGTQGYNLAINRSNKPSEEISISSKAFTFAENDATGGLLNQSSVTDNVLTI